MDSGLTGGCACGAARWRATAAPLWAAHCHCESCRRATSSPFTSFFGVADEAVEWMGAPVCRESSPGVHRAHCSACGAPVSYRADRWPGETHLYAAGLDDPAAYRPTAHVYWAERLAWVTVEDDLPKHEGSADQT